MSLYVQTYTFANGQTADGGQVNTELVALGNSVNNIVDAQVASGAAIAISKLATTGTLGSAVLFLGSNLTIEGSKTANQAQSTTTTYFTISGIADEDSGWIEIRAGGNMPADRVYRAAAFAWYRTGGVMNISAGSTTFIDINATSAGLTLAAVASSGTILVKVTTSAFGAGAFKGNVHVKCGSLSSGMTIA